MAELVRLLGIWNKVQAFISDSSLHSNSQRAIKFNELVQLFEPIERTLQVSVTNICSLAELYNENPKLVTCVFSVYHLSRLLLHASMVPLLSGCSVGTPAERDSAQENDGAALQQAVSFVKLLQQVITNDLDITRLWPFIGYGTFVAGSVFVAHNSTMQSSRSIGLSVQGIGRDAEEIKTIQTVLEVFSIYWKPLRQLAIKFGAAINVEVGQFSELDLITSSIYPYDVRPSSHSLEEHALTQTRAPRTSHSIRDLPSQQVHEPYSSDVSEAERQENGVESYQMLPSPEEQLYSESGFQLGLEGNMMTADCGSGLLGTDLWNEWDYQTLPVAADYCDSSAFPVC